MKLGRRGWVLVLILAACAKLAVEVAPWRPVYAVGYEETGPASWRRLPSRAARAELFEMSQMTAAHATLPLESWVVVESLLNGRTVEARITGRGPLGEAPILDLSHAAARALGAAGEGVIPVRLRVVSLPGSPTGARSGSFSVQVASFTNEYRALVLKSILDEAWRGAYVQRAEAAGRALYRVRVGAFSTRREARRLARSLAASGYPVIVIEE